MNVTQRLALAILSQAIADLQSPSEQLRKQAKALFSNRDAVHSLCKYLALDAPPEASLAGPLSGFKTIH